MRTACTLARAIAIVALTAVVASPSAAQSPAPATGAEPGVRLLAFAFGTVERFAAGQTFDAVFGSSTGAFWGAGVELAFRRGLFVDVAASRFRKSDGERVFIDNGQIIPMGIPLTATLTPFEMSAGFRFKPRARTTPYIGAGLGSYRYEEVSELADSEESFSARHMGALLAGGIDVRLNRWIVVSAGGQFTYIGGILGEGGVSQAYDEGNLGGVDARFRLIVGR